LGIFIVLAGRNWREKIGGSKLGGKKIGGKELAGKI
jgi:hypothetical protein